MSLWRSSQICKAFSRVTYSQSRYQKHTWPHEWQKTQRCFSTGSYSIYTSANQNLDLNLCCNSRTHNVQQYCTRRTLHTQTQDICCKTFTSNDISVFSVQSSPLWKLHKSIPYNNVASFHTSVTVFDPKSKLEESVIVLKEKVKDKDKSPDETKSVSDKPLVPVDSSPKSLAKNETSVVAKTTKKSIKQRIIDEVKHYYHGFRLLAIDTKIAAKLVWQVMTGSTLTRRERRQLVRTTADLFRLVPFSVFVIVPFMEFLLPVALKLFPQMLPSTFNVKSKEEEAARKRLKVKLEVAKFLQDTVEEMALEKKDSSQSEVAEFREFMTKIRSEGRQTSTDEIMKYSQLFQDELTLDNLKYDQLVAMCKLINIPTIGTSYFLRFQLRLKLRHLETDDRSIRKEGIESLAVWELQEANRTRGMRALGCSEERLKQQLLQWLELHLDKRVPASLLLLSRTLYLPAEVSSEDKIKATISALPETTAEEAQLHISEVSGERIDNKAKLEVIKQEQEMLLKDKKEADAKKKKIQEEKEAKKKAAEEAAQAADEAAQAAEGVLAAVQGTGEPDFVVRATANIPLPPQLDQDTTPQSSSPATAAAPSPQPTAPPGPVVAPPVSMAGASDALTIPPDELLVDKAPTVEGLPGEVLVDKSEDISREDLKSIEKVLDTVAEERLGAKIDEEEFKELKEDVSSYKENLASLKNVIVETGGSEKDLQESKGAKRLAKRVDKLIGQIDHLLKPMIENRESLIEDIKHDEGQIGDISVTSTTSAPSVAESNTATGEPLPIERGQQIVMLQEELKEKRQNLVSIDEMIGAMQRLQTIPDDTKLNTIMKVLDADQDGVIDITDALDVIAILSQDKVDVKAEHVAEIMKLLKKEEMLEEKEKRNEENDSQTNSDSSLSSACQESVPSSSKDSTV